MNWLIPKGKVGKQISIQNLFSIFLVGTFIVTGIGISGLWANEDNTENFSYQNAAQAHHARNVAKLATFQDADVAEAFARAKESKDSQDFQDARELFHDKLAYYSQKISDMRSSGMGWGNIAKHLDVHPSVLGRGHSKFSGKHNFSYSKDFHRHAEKTENYLNKTSYSYQNAAQTHHARNVAKLATFQDADVAEAFARAKESKDSQDFQDARELFHDKLAYYSQKISDMRSSGMGWGNIAKHLDVHPSVLGRGHSKFSTKHNFTHSKHSRMRSKIKTATAKSYKGKDAKAHHDRGAVSKGKSFGVSLAKGPGPSNGRGLNSGHSKGNAGASPGGHSVGQGNGHGGGHGNGHGGGNGGGNGNGNGR